MATTKSLFCSATLLLLVVIVNIQQAHAQCGGFQGSCNSFAIGSDGVFTGNCETDGGTFEASSIDLNNFISNSNGDLINGNDFLASCQGLGYINESAPKVVFFIVANCAQDDGSVVSATFELSSNLANINGVLTFQTC